MKTCATCRFFDITICRRYPPTLNPDGRDLFPMPDPAGWCGEWKAKTPDRKKPTRPLADRILAAIQRAGPAGLTTSQITCRFSRYSKTGDRFDILTKLIVQGKVEARTDGRTTRYMAVKAAAG